MKVAITGSTGLIGSALVQRLEEKEHEVIRLVRSQQQARKTDIYWDPQISRLNPDHLKEIDAVVHLAGENISRGRWTAARKRRIRDSRIQATRFLCETLRQLSHPPRVLVSASATGYYGNRGDRKLVEVDDPGQGFLAELVQEWEQATLLAVEKGIRVVQARFGVVLSPTGGALARMTVPFRMGLGGKIGNGRQYISWIALDDAVGAICRALDDDSLAGPVNIVSPGPVTNAEFTRTLGKILGRSTLLPLPAFAARLALGKMADELLLASTRVIPARLQGVGYEFLQPKLEGALRHLLGETRDQAE